MEWTTRVSELLGCRYPILQGAIAGLGNWRLAAAVAGAGAYGTITASVSRTPERLRQDIRRCREATDGSFGVNLSFGNCPRIEEMLEVCIEERVPVETAAYKPDSLAPRIKEGGLKWLHKAARVKDAAHAEGLGVDAVILVGLEGAGIKSPEQLPTLTAITWGKRQLKVPLIAAGGIGDAYGFLGALGMGADGIMMGTAFLATRESPSSEAFKKAVIAVRPDDPEFRRRVLTGSSPGSKEKLWEMTGSAAGKGDYEEAAPASLAAGVIDHVPTVKELVEGIVRGAEEILDSWRFLKTR